MGDRGQVQLVSQGDPDIYLYTHWGATNLPGVVADALVRGRDRWGDDEYLNRVIFSEMIQGNVLSNTGYGIGTSLHSDTWLVVEVDHVNQKAGVKEVQYGSNSLDYDEFKASQSYVYTTEMMPFELFIAEHSAVTIK